VAVIPAEARTVPSLGTAAGELEALAPRLEDAWSGAEEELGRLRATAAETDALDRLWTALAERLERDRAVVVESVPTHCDAVLLALTFGVGTPSSLGNGDGLIHEVRPKPLTERRDISTTRAEFPLHTDSTALVRPHEAICLACLRAPAGAGGQSLVATADSVRAALPDSAVAALAEPVFPFLLKDPVHGRGVRPGPVLEGSGAVRYRRDALELGERLSREPMPPRSRAALELLDEALDDRSLVLTRALRPGDVLLVDNRRALHGRTAIADGADRRLRRLKLFSEA
jgi:hypothetical protein